MANVYSLARKTKPKKLSMTEEAALLKEFRDAVESSWQHESDNIKEAQDDLEAIAGNQWPEAVRRERDEQGRPMITVNKLPQFLRQVTNDIRQADLAIKTSPVDDESDPELAKVFDGILKQIQYQSSAKHVFSKASEDQAGCGIGWFRIKAEYADDSAFDQELRVEAIRNPLAVFWDPASILPDRSDAMWISVTELLPKATFKARYPDAAEASVQVPNEGSSAFWSEADDIRIAEFWRKVPYDKTLSLMPNGETVCLDELDPMARMSMQPPVKQRKVKAHKVESWIISGSQVLSGPHPWAGKYIPIVPVIGAEIALEKRIYRYGVIRFAREPQQLYNVYRTASAEAVMLAPKAPWLATPNMIGPYKGMWDNANRGNIPYLLYDPDPTAPGAMPQRQPPVQINAAFMQESSIAADDMKATTGIYDASLGQRSNETAGVAIRARQQEGDVANYHFIDNLKRSLEHAGRILLDLIPKVYDNERVVRIMGEGDQEQFVRINHVMMGVDGEPVLLNDLSAGRFDIRVTIGPNYATKRFEAAANMLDLLKAFPQAAPIISDLIVKNMDWPGADEIAKRLRQTVPPNILHDPEDPNSPPPPDPTQSPQFQIEADKAMAEIENKRMATAKIRAEIAKLEAEAMLAPQQFQLEFMKATQIADSVAPKPGNDNAGPQPPMPPMPPAEGVPPLDGSMPFDPAAMPIVPSVPPPDPGASPF